jgi:3-hydroxyisobutyrate dehydrogenase-like beta-hydroxyacid dehydrogenase
MYREDSPVSSAWRRTPYRPSSLVASTQVFLAADGVPAAIRLDLAKKDLDFDPRSGPFVRQRLPQTEVNARVLEDAARAGFGDHDVSAVAEHSAATPLPSDADRPGGGRP